MKKEDIKRVLVLSLWLILTLIIFVTLWYFVHTYSLTIDKKIPLEELSNKQYVSRDNAYEIAFNNDATLAIFANDVEATVYETSMTENVLSLTNGSTVLTFLLLDEFTLFEGDFGYFYLYER